jgi:hypothetical protein
VGETFREGVIVDTLVTVIKPVEVVLGEEVGVTGSIPVAVGFAVEGAIDDCGNDEVGVEDSVVETVVPLGVDVVDAVRTEEGEDEVEMDDKAVVVVRVVGAGGEGAVKKGMRGLSWAENK